MKERIIILGAGFGGVRAALDLRKLLPKSQITVVNNTPYHCYHPDLYEVATAKLEHETTLEIKNLAGTVNLPLEDIFKSKNISLLIDQVKEVDLKSKTVITGKNNLTYDYLVLSLGSETNFFGIEGAKEYSHTLKSTQDALNIRNNLTKLSKKKQDLTVILAGGGLTGVELAGEMSHYLTDSAKIKIVEAMESVLPGLSVWTQEKASQRLNTLGVEILTNHPIKKIDQRKIYFEAEEIDYDYLIWTTGIKGVDLSEKIKGVEFNKKSQIPVQLDLSLENFPEVFCIGDLSEIFDEERNAPVPSTAWAAVSQAKLAATNIVLRLKNLPTQKYTPPSSVFIIPIGGQYAITTLSGINLSGLLPWILKELIALKYFMTIVNPVRAFSIWWKGVRIYIQND